MVIDLGKGRTSTSNKFSTSFGSLLRYAMFRIVSVGPIPSHLAFIMDANRRYAKTKNLGEIDGHRAGFSGLMSVLKHCYELGIEYTTVYAFSIDNFKRKPAEVKGLMELMLENIEGLLKEESIVNQYGIRVYFIGNIRLLNESVRVAAEKAMMATEKHNKCVLLICVAYSSTDEIVHSVQECCRDKSDRLKNLICARKEDKRNIKLVDIENNMHMKVAPDPDVVIRTSGETLLSNLLWPEPNYQC